MKTMNLSLHDLILSLEKRLFDRAIRGDVDELSQLLAQDFVEIGARGASWDRAEVLACLPQQEFVQRVLSDFKLTVLADGVVLASYICEVPGEEGPVRSLRSSIWKQIEGRWQMVFHQGTKMATAG